MMSENSEKYADLILLSDEQFEDIPFWSGMLNESDKQSVVKRPDEHSTLLDNDALPENISPKEIPEKVEEEIIIKKRNMLFYILIAVAFFIFFITSSLTAYFVFFYEKPIEETEEIEVIPIPKEEKQDIEYYTIAWEPFWLRIQQGGKEHFVNLSFSTSTSAQKVVQEVEHKKLILRDAIYYYLQRIQLSTTKETIEKIRKDIIDILNSNITSGTIDSLGVETFFIQ